MVKRKIRGLGSMKEIAEKQMIQSGHISKCPFCEKIYHEKDLLAIHIADEHNSQLKLLIELFQLKQSIEPETWREDRDIIWDAPNDEFMALSSGEIAFYKFILKISDNYYVKAICAFPEFYRRVLDMAYEYKHRKEQTQHESEED